MVQAEARAQRFEARGPGGHGGKSRGPERGQLVGQDLDVPTPTVPGRGIGACLRAGQAATGTPIAGTEPGLGHLPIPCRWAPGLELPEPSGEPLPEPTNPPPPSRQPDMAGELLPQPTGQPIPGACRQDLVTRAGRHPRQASQANLRIPDIGQRVGAPVHGSEPASEVPPANRRTDPFQQCLQSLEIPTRLMDRIPVGSAFQPGTGRTRPLDDQALDGVGRGLAGSEAE